jgi:nitrogen fixation/metabolism regulation signal transduction histidine kinase
MVKRAMNAGIIAIIALLHMNMIQALYVLCLLLFEILRMMMEELGGKMSERWRQKMVVVFAVVIKGVQYLFFELLPYYGKI